MRYHKYSTGEGWFKLAFAFTLLFSVAWMAFVVWAIIAVVHAVQH